MKNRTILTYKVDKETAAVITARYGSKYEILDVSDCFMDLLVLSAAARIVDPDELYDEDVELLTDIYKWDPDEVIVFTCCPAYPEKLTEITWKVFKHSKKEKSNMTGIRKYSKDEFRNMIEKIDKYFYRSTFLNYSGTSKEGEYYTELVAEWLLEKTEEEITTLLLSGTEVYPEKVYDAGPIHKKENISFNDSGRDEENIAKKLMQQGTAGNFAILDYQVPVNRAMGSKNGKVDVVLSNGEKIILGELKDADSGESFLRAIVEIITYYKMILRNEMLRNRFIRDYSLKKDDMTACIIPAVILFEETRPYKEYCDCDESKPRVRQLAQRLGVQVIKISPGELPAFAIKDTDYTLQISI